MDEVLTHINDTNIHAKGFAGKVGDVLHIVAVIEERHSPVEYRSPYTNPCHELRIQSDVVFLNDVEYGIVEERDQTGNSYDRKRLAREKTEDYRRECR